MWYKREISCCSDLMCNAAGLGVFCCYCRSGWDQDRRPADLHVA
jgi:hypothetical protein